MNKSLNVCSLVWVMFFMVFSVNVFSASPIYTGLFSNTALKGFDAVSYFQGDGVPVKGSSKYQTQWRGADWWFVSKENLAAFTSNPEKFAPQYGGYCAFATAQGKLVKGDPLVYTVLGEKLYLNYNQKIDRDWQADRVEMIKQADNEYPNLIDLDQRVKSK